MARWVGKSWPADGLWAQRRGYDRLARCGSAGSTGVVGSAGSTGMARRERLGNRELQGGSALVSTSPLAGLRQGGGLAATAATGADTGHSGVGVPWAALRASKFDQERSAAGKRPRGQRGAIVRGAVAAPAGLVLCKRAESSPTRWERSGRLERGPCMGACGGAKAPGGAHSSTGHCCAERGEWAVQAREAVHAVRALWRVQPSPIEQGG